MKLGQHFLIAIPAAIMLFASVYAGAGYSNLKQDFDSWQPPAAFVSPIQKEPTADSIVSARPVDDQSRWLRLPAEPWQEAAFWPIKPAEAETWQAIAGDSLAAAQAMANRFDMETVIALIGFRNPDIQAAHHRFKAALQGFSQVAYLDQVLARYSAFSEALINGIGPMKGATSIDKQFPFPGVSALKGRIVNQRAHAAFQSMEIVRRDAITTGCRAYWELSYVRQAIDIAADTLDVLKNLEAVADARYRSGTTSYQDVIKITIERKLLENQLSTLAQQQKNIETLLNATMNLPVDNRLGRPQQLVADRRVPALGALFPIAKQHRQELLRLRADIASKTIVIDLAETLILPPLTLNLSLFADAAALQVGTGAVKPTFADTVAAARGAGLPKAPWYGANDAWLQQSRQELLALQKQLKGAENMTDAALRQAWFALDKAARETRLYDKSLIALSRSAFEVSTSGYETGRVAFVDMMAAYTSWLNFRLALARRQSDLGIAWAELAQVVGIWLPADSATHDEAKGAGP